MGVEHPLVISFRTCKRQVTPLGTFLPKESSQDTAKTKSITPKYRTIFPKYYGSG